MRLILVALSILATLAVPVSANEFQKRGIDYLKGVMDEFHDRIPVYDDVSSPGNRFHMPAKIPDGAAAVTMNGSSTNNPHSGATAIRFQFIDISGPNFGGFYFLNGVLPSGAVVPQLNFGTVPNAGVDLRGATQLTFWARGEQGGERIEFFMGGVGRDPVTNMPAENHPDSTPRRSLLTEIATLTTNWKKYTIDLRDLIDLCDSSDPSNSCDPCDPDESNLCYILGGFGWVADDANNPGGAVFYVDDIQYDLTPERRAQRLNEARFLRSFTTEPFQSQPAPVGEFDLVFRNLAFTYDNALALLAFLADGTSDSLRRARIIGDAFVYASQNDRFFNDGQLRTAYAAGDIALPPGWTPNGRLGTVPVSGFWDEVGGAFVEVQQGSVDVGNNAWAMMALLALHRRTGDPVYFDTARRIGEYILTFRQNSGQFRGFLGRLDKAETPNPVLQPWASAEHNLDVLAAFVRMHAVSGDTKWLINARHAKRFVEDMIDDQTGCLLAGTRSSTERNSSPGELPLDTQSWGVLAQPTATALHPQLLTCATQHHQLVSEGFKGFDFNDDRDGVWFEGTAQMAAALALAGRQTMSDTFLIELRRAQATPPFGDGNGLAAGSRNGISTGFGFSLFRRLHVADVAWHGFAELGFNPFWPFGPMPLSESSIAGPTLLLLLDGD